MNCCAKYILTFNDVVRYQKIVIMNNDVDITSTSLFAWSFDGCCYTDFATRASYETFMSSYDGDYYLRVLVNVPVVRVYFDSQLVTCYNVAMYNESMFGIDPCTDTTTALFSPYAGLDCALQLESQLNAMIGCLFGIPIYYFRTTPDGTTSDYIFKEYTLHNCVGVKMLKMIVNGNELPSSKPTFSDWDYDWELDFDVEITKSAFAQAFGDDASPHQRDFIYVPMMKRMYEVNSAYDEKAGHLMYRAMTWKLGLVKWQQKTNVDTTQYDALIHDMIANNVSDVFELGQLRDERLSDTQSLSASNAFLANGLYDVRDIDYTRRSISRDIVFIDAPINHRSTQVTKNAYRMHRDASTNAMSCVVYDAPFCGDEMTLSIVLRVDASRATSGVEGGLPLFTIGDDIVALCSDAYEVENTNGDTTRCVDITFNDASITLECGVVYLVTFRFSFTMHVIQLTAYHHALATRNEDVPLYKRRPEMYEFAFDDPTNDTCAYDDAFTTLTKEDVRLWAPMCDVMNVKLFTRFDTPVGTLLRYTLNDKTCLINDACRKIEDVRGYTIQ